MNSLVKANTQISTNNILNEENEDQFLTFMLGGEMFALEILNIKEIIEYGQVTTVPMMPGFVRGVINLRGAVVPVIDLSIRFGAKKTEVGKRTCIVIVEIELHDEKHVIGVIVDSVSEVLAIPNTQIEKAPAFGAKLRADFIKGMGKIDSRFVIILNIEQVLSMEEMLELVEKVEDVKKLA